MLPTEISLRPMTVEDLPVLFQQQIDPAAMHQAAFIHPNHTDWQIFQQRWSGFLTNPAMVNRIILYHGQVAGQVAQYTMDEQRYVTYWIDRQYWGRGIASQALALLLAEVRDRPLYAYVATDNDASRRVLEKNGFVIIKKETGFSHARGIHMDEYLLELR